MKFDYLLRGAFESEAEALKVMKRFFEDCWMPSSVRQFVIEAELAV